MGIFKKKQRDGIALIAASAAPRAALPRRKLAHEVLAETSELAYMSFLALTSCVFLRPSDLLPDLFGDLPLIKILSASTLFFCAPQLMKRLNLHELRKQPIIACFLAFFIAAVVSQLVHAFLFFVKIAVINFALLGVYLIAMLTIIDTPKRLHSFLKVLALSAASFVFLCMLDFWGVLDFETIEKLRQGTTQMDSAGKRVYVERMQGAGLFFDPNDLSQLTVLSGIIFCYLISRKDNGSARFIWWVPLLTMCMGLTMTQSRGGLLAAAAGAAAVISVHFGRKVCIAAVVVGLAGMTAMGGRQASVDLSNDTGGARLKLWREGFVAMTGKDAIFGVGYGMYDEVAELLAHNSFVHAYVETGLVGGTFFFGMFFFAILALIRMKIVGIDHLPESLRAFHPYCAALTVAYVVGMFSLSRNYVLPTYQIVGTAAVYVNLVCIRLKPPQLVTYVDKPHVYRMVFGSAICFSFFYGMVRIFAR